MMNRSRYNVTEFPVINQSVRNGATQKNGSRKEAAKILDLPISEVEEKTTRRRISTAEKPRRQNRSHQFWKPSENVKTIPIRMNKSHKPHEKRESAIVRLRL